MTISEQFDEFYTRYQYPVVEELTVGYSGIDPPFKNDGEGMNHEELNNLLGGDDTGHYHLTKEQLEQLYERLIKTYPPLIYSNQSLDLIPYEEMTPYEVQGENIRRDA